MDKFEDDFHNADSSFDEILDLVFIRLEDEDPDKLVLSEEDQYYRPLEEY